MATRRQLRIPNDAVPNRMPELGSLHRFLLIALVTLAPGLAGSLQVETLAACQLASDAAESESLRGMIDDELQIAIKSGELDVHGMTIHFLAGALAQLGQFEALETLRGQVRAAGHNDLTHAISGDFNFVVAAAYEARGNYAAALNVLRTQLTMSGSQHFLTIRAIRRGDLAAAEQLIQDSTTAEVSVENPSYGRRPMLLANAELAIAAHRLGEQPRVETALRRYRAILEGSELVSTRPLDDDVQWLRSDPVYGPYFVMALASCGKGTLAESLWNSESISEWPGDIYSVQPRMTTRNLCCRLALAGEGEIALRIARNAFGDDTPVELCQALCRFAVENGDHEAAKRFAEEFFSRVDRLSFDYVPPHSAPSHRLSEQAILLHRLGAAAGKLRMFLHDMRADEQSDLREGAARLYIKLADRFADEFENRTTVADVNSLRALMVNSYQYKLEPIVDILPLSEVQEFVRRQEVFFVRNSQFLEDAFSFFEARPIEEYAIALAKRGQSPGNHVTRFSVQQREAIIERLLKNGNRQGARSVLEKLIREVSHVPHLSYVSGSDGGRVVKGATQNRYTVGQLAVACGELDSGIGIIELLKDPGERTDGYRCLARAYVESTDAATAFAWAKSLPDGRFRLAACVGVLQGEVKGTITDEPGELEESLQDLQAFGVPFILWGC